MMAMALKVHKTVPPPENVRTDHDCTLRKTETSCKRVVKLRLHVRPVRYTPPPFKGMQSFGSLKMKGIVCRRKKSEHTRV